jgi:hypothetical protein
LHFFSILGTAICVHSSLQQFHFHVGVHAFDARVPCIVTQRAKRVLAFRALCELIRFFNARSGAVSFRAVDHIAHAVQCFLQLDAVVVVGRLLIGPSNNVIRHQLVGAGRIETGQMFHRTMRKVMQNVFFKTRTTTEMLAMVQFKTILPQKIVVTHGASVGGGLKCFVSFDLVVPY